MQNELKDFAWMKITHGIVPDKLIAMACYWLSHGPTRSKDGGGVGHILLFQMDVAEWIGGRWEGVLMTIKLPVER